MDSIKEITEDGFGFTRGMGRGSVAYAIYVLIRIFDNIDNRLHGKDL
ncbi:MAG: hypothetical protein HUJ74_02140 [Lachnospiraceae bacterium]|nr:hypothetical protein [Lachnospiraceae bacterium]